MNGRWVVRDIEREGRVGSENQDTREGLHLDRIGQIALTVSDLERAKDFYGNRLGMRHLFDAGAMSFFQRGEIRLLIGASGKPVQPGGSILYFRVAEIHAAHAALEGHGVSFTRKPHLVAKMPDHDLWVAFTNDPDGNPIGVMCEAPHASGG